MDELHIICLLILFFCVSILIQSKNIIIEFYEKEAVFRERDDNANPTLPPIKTINPDNVKDLNISNVKMESSIFASNTRIEDNSPAKDIRYENNTKLLIKNIKELQKNAGIKDEFYKKKIGDKTYYKQVFTPIKQHSINIFIKRLNNMYPDERYGLMEVVSSEQTELNDREFKISSKVILYDKLEDFARTFELITVSRPDGVVIIEEVKLVTFRKEDKNDPSYNIRPQHTHNNVRILNTLFLQEPHLTDEQTHKNVASESKKFDPNSLLVTPKDFTSENYKCFDSENNITRHNSKDECDSVKGIWDTPVLADAECGFYKQNKNYPNDFGGRNGDKCTFPLGMKRKGFRKHDLNPDFVPLCHNCVNEDGSLFTGKCCDKQDSPDYAFENDSELRTIGKKQLEEKGLKV